MNDFAWDDLDDWIGVKARERKGVDREKTKISVITAVLNGERTLRDCMESVLHQSYPAEHIIVDGGSTDGTIEIVGEYVGKLGKVVSGLDKGIYDAMNIGIALATGDVVGILNADDYYPNADVLAKVSQVFGDKSVYACYGDLDYVDNADTGRIVRRWRSGFYDSRRFYQGWMPPHPAFFVRKVCYETFGKFRMDMGSTADYELMLRFMVKHGIKARYIPDVLVHMRTGGASNASLLNRIRANRMDRKAWRVIGLKPYPWTLILKPLRKIGQYL